jgi:hypothetical protein
MLLMVRLREGLASGQAQWKDEVELRFLNSLLQFDGALIGGLNGDTLT